VRNAEEEQAIREFCKKINLPIAVILPFDEQVTDADLKGVSIMDYDKDAKVVKAMEVFVQTLELN
jgi:CO dehydrogenase maturation factor